LIAFSYPSSIAHPSIRQKERKPFLKSRSKKPQKKNGVSFSAPRVTSVKVEQKGFSCHFNERLRYKILYVLMNSYFAASLLLSMPPSLRNTLAL
jgi:hypothetical protein